MPPGPSERKSVRPSVPPRAKGAAPEAAHCFSTLLRNAANASSSAPCGWGLLQSPSKPLPKTRKLLCQPSACLLRLRLLRVRRDVAEARRAGLDLLAPRKQLRRHEARRHRRRLRRLLRGLRSHRSRGLRQKAECSHLNYPTVSKGCYCVRARCHVAF